MRLNPRFDFRKRNAINRFTVLGLMTLVLGLVGTSRFTSAQELPADGQVFQPPSESELIGREVPNIELITSAGQLTTLAELSSERPIFTTLVFSRCAGICSPYLGLLKKTVKSVGGSGNQYQMVVISFDLRDAQSDLLALAAHHELASDSGWTFAAPRTEADRDALCQAFDFDYRWDEQRQQYDHPAITVGLRGNRIVRLSVGEEISPARFREMIAELRGQYVPVYPEPGARATLFRCFDYDPQRGFTPNWGMLVLVAPAMVTLVVVVTLFWLVKPKPFSNGSR